MQTVTWYIVVGALLVAMALGGSVLKRLPLSTSLLYLLVGLVLGRLKLGYLSAFEHTKVLELLTELAVIVSLFTAGLKLRAPLSFPGWRVALRLATLGMVVTVGLVALAGVYLLHLPWGAAVLLGAVLAPTDPVLASDVQVESPFQGEEHGERLRFGLTGEAGLNDGSAFPFVMLGLGLLGLHELGPGLWRWVAVDVLWATAAGLGVGALLGHLVGWLVLYLRKRHREAVGLDDFLAMGLIALSYGCALLVHAYGFLAVFAAGLALRRIEKQATEGRTPEQVEAAARSADEHDVATHPELAPAYMAKAVLGFNEQLERIGEVTIVVLLGVLISSGHLPREALWFIPLLFLVFRPLSVFGSLVATPTSRGQRAMMGWFGIRGIGSLYYLFYALSHGLPRPLGERLVPLVLATVAASVLLHGISVTPLMRRYERQPPAGKGEAATASRER